MANGRHFRENVPLNEAELKKDHSHGKQSINELAVTHNVS